MTWTLHILKDSETTVVKRYPSANLCCDAVLKAKAYYEKLKEVVTIKMMSEEGHLVFEGKVNEDI